MAIIITILKNIKKGVGEWWIRISIIAALSISVASMLFVGGMLFEKYMMSKRYPLSITLNEEVTRRWDSYLATRKQHAQYIASRNGTKFYPINCSYATRIKEENRVYFTNREDALGLEFEESGRC